MKAAELGCSIREPWIVYNAATYLWNHSGHLIEGGKFVDLVEGLRALLPYIKEVQPQLYVIPLPPIACIMCYLLSFGLSSNPELLSHISAALAQGIVQRWMPVVPEPSSDTNASSVKKKCMFCCKVMRGLMLGLMVGLMLGLMQGLMLGLI